MNVYDASRTEVYFKPESEIGVLSSTRGWKRLRIISENLVNEKATKQRRFIGAVSAATDISFSDSGVSGSLSCNLSPQDFDLIFEGVMQTHWSGKGLRQSRTLRTYSMMVVQRVGDKLRRTVVTGCAFSKCSFAFQVNSPVKFTFNIVALGVLRNYIEPSEIMHQPSSFNDFLIGLDSSFVFGNKRLENVASVTGSFGYNVQLVKCASRLAPKKLKLGAFDANLVVTGPETEDEIFLKRYTNETYGEALIVSKYKNEGYEFRFPKVFVTAYNAPSASQGALLYNVTLQPIYESNLGSTVFINRIPRS